MADKKLKELSEQRFHVLDSFRGICALLVVLFHVRIVETIVDASFFRNSALFVSFFFVLSGFVLAHRYGFKPDFNFKKFIISRTSRIYPLHIVMLIVFIIIEIGKYFAANYGINFNNEPFTGQTSLSEIIPNMLLIQSWTHYTEQLSFNYLSWSISIEYYMYIIFAITLFLIKSPRYLIWGAVAIATYMLIFLGDTTLTKQSLNGLSCFFSGALVYFLYKKMKDRSRLNKAIATIIEVIVIGLVIIAVSVSYPNKLIVCSLVFCLAIYIFAHEQGWLSDILKGKIFIYLGKLSYSIYLIHGAILFCMISFFIILQKILGLNFTVMLDGVRYIDLGDNYLNNSLVFLVLFVVVVISNITYKYIEIKGQIIMRRALTNSK